MNPLAPEALLIILALSGEPRIDRVPASLCQEAAESLKAKHREAYCVGGDLGQNERAAYCVMIGMVIGRVDLEAARVVMIEDQKRLGCQ